MAGWCPRHDRVYPGRTTCPDCATPLVTIDPPRPREMRSRRPVPEPQPPIPDEPEPIDPHPEIVGITNEGPHPPRAPRLARSVIALAVAIALTGALAVGALLPRNDGPAGAPAPSPSASLEPVRLQRAPRVLASLAGVTLRLDRYTQAGGHVDVSVTVLEGLNPVEVSEVFVDVLLWRGGRLALEDATNVTPGLNGFAFTILLPEADQRIRQIRITGIRTVSREHVVRLATDIDASWPVAAADEPVVLQTRRAGLVAGDEIRWTSTLLWKERVEVVLDLSDFNRTRRHFFGRTELYYEMRDKKGGVPATLLEWRDPGDRLHLEFDNVDPQASRIVLFLAEATTVHDGPWAFWLGPTRRVADP